MIAKELNIAKGLLAAAELKAKNSKVANKTPVISQQIKGANPTEANGFLLKIAGK